MKILLVDHIFHKKTQSSNFFTTLLRSFSEVEIHYVDPDQPATIAGLEVQEDVDLVVLWQMDYLAPIFLARGLKTVVVPMYDGSSLMPDLHWLWSRHARYVNFSRRLHDRTRRLGLSSHLVKYFMPPVRENLRPKFDKLRVLLWQRRPEHGINLALVERMLGKQLYSVHVHDAPDDPKLNSKSYCTQSLDGYELTVSRWFANRQDYYKLMQECNVFVAPRRSEGIGMGLLEAMSCGMLVLAADAPTHDEYICNWLNGILFNPDSVGYADVAQAAPSIGEMAWRTVKEGYAAFRRSESRLIEFISSTPKPPRAPSLDDGAFALSLVKAYMSGLEAYKGYLLNNVTLIEAMNQLSLRGKLTSDGIYNAEARAQRAGLPDQKTQMPWLRQSRLDSAAIAAGGYMQAGQVVKHDGAAWVVGEQLQLGFRLDPRLGATERLSIEFRKAAVVQSFQYCVMLNGRTLGMGERSGDDGRVDFDIPGQIISVENVLHVQINAPTGTQSSPSGAAVGVEAIVFG
jgi:hypothetical protein